MRVVKTTTIELTADERQTLANAVECLRNIAYATEDEIITALEKLNYCRIDDTINTIEKLLALNKYAKAPF